MQLEEIRTDDDMIAYLAEEWLRVLARLWEAVNKPIDKAQLTIYRRELRTIPLGLLEKAVSRAIRDNGRYQTVPTIGAVWDALKTELDHPYDIEQAMHDWVDHSWSAFLHPFGTSSAAECDATGSRQNVAVETAQSELESANVR